MSVSGDDGEGEEPKFMVEGKEEESSRGLGEDGEGPGEGTGEDVEGEIAHEDGRGEAGGTASISVSIYMLIQVVHVHIISVLLTVLIPGGNA